ncbi:hypothetical protein FOD75_10925 (plasmid) [Limosilactobacillus reuteri]|uniref:Uncharacterized protein n=1 Tax=Limosilactobacillus reuteri TaxID=1598 RepID=A0A517D8B7_LIMRT|nr:hypothetical protein [Limosilactobacillus reuteri]QDR73602.1 hypothetical protein FOD75_10925 [Limosilactobacillus reuteri]
MIKGLDFDMQTIATEEAKYLLQFYSSDDPLLDDATSYYAILFNTFLNRNADQVFQNKDPKEQTNILDKEILRFKKAMRYAFNKGHQTAFVALLLKSSQIFDPSFFEKPESREYFIYNFENLMTDEAFKANLTRDAIDNLIGYTRKNFENGYNEIMKYGQIFFKKGAAVAFDQVREHIVNKKYKITGYSRMMHVPFNQTFELTPAFKASFSLESPAFEAWNVQWDESYGFDASKSLVAKVTIHQFTKKSIGQYRDVEARTYMMIANQFEGYADEELVYLVQIDYLVADNKYFPRILEHNEYQAILMAIQNTVCRRLQVDGNHVFTTD